ncbi:MAG: 3,4-dihydroxy-2-butanone-4-phosphate synthase [Rhodobacteraceae bacterium]|nr:3,4-dihydroxy-2-butanone-4-phosphate synthase [Paracoccaceae bacterium]
MSQNPFAGDISPIEEILEDARAGRMFVLVDHEDRENEGDLVIPAEMADDKAINFMATHGRGLICLTMTGEQVARLGVPMMTSSNSSRHETPFTVSIEAVEGVTTGISAQDRAKTVATAINPQVRNAEIATPGHVFPLRAREGGVLVRAGHTEAATDIARLAGLNPSGVICEIMNEDGTMARLPDLIDFSKKHELKIGTISDLIAYRLRHDHLVVEVSSREVVSEYGGTWQLRIFRDTLKGVEHPVLTKGDISGGPLMVRMHAASPSADMLGLVPGKAGELAAAMRMIAAEGRGAVVLLRDMVSSVGLDVAPERTLKQYGLGAQILAALGLNELILLSNSPSPNVVALDGYGLSIVETRKIEGV